MHQPRIVLVHGAFTDPSSWAGVIEDLHADGLGAEAVANPLRGLAIDAAHVTGAIRRITDPVVLVGHCYGGAVITNVATDNVVALVYVAGFGLDWNESVVHVYRRFAPTLIADAIVGRSDAELAVRCDRFRDVLAGDLPARRTAVLAAAQRPIARSALTAGSAAPAWAKLPSWYVIATSDRALNAHAQRFMAQRMAAHELHLNGSHLIHISQPRAVAGMIRAAAGRQEKTS
ncbi:alpha/beta hydrolase [Nonomuraea sp. SYSU D8015]|uniref:alpha/beta hydrolase n=1 Tax=Nonomuraea sp. SYSU D8015 TaxID=2593644 RepID=UPI0016614541|nr:alpha/beta hydrolase [Nonomuraea sp. SYSU D8015]